MMTVNCNSLSDSDTNSLLVAAAAAAAAVANTSTPEPTPTPTPTTTTTLAASSTCSPGMQSGGLAGAIKMEPVQLQQQAVANLGNFGHPIHAAANPQQSTLIQQQRADTNNALLGTGSSTPTPTPSTTNTPASSSTCSPNNNNNNGAGQQQLQMQMNNAGFPQQQHVQYGQQPGEQQYGANDQVQQLIQTVDGSQLLQQQQTAHLHGLAMDTSTTATTTATTNTANNTELLVSTDLSHLGTTGITQTGTTGGNTLVANADEQQQSASEADDELQFINHIDDQRSRFGLNRGDACEILALTLAEAHIGTCLVSSQRIDELITMKRRDITGNGAISNKKYNYLSSLSYEELWLECANRLTNIIQQIIEFAKMVPSFMLMEQDDQIVLLKAGSFELCCLRISRYYDLETNQLLFGNGLIPMDLFIRASGKF